MFITEVVNSVLPWCLFFSTEYKCVLSFTQNTMLSALLPDISSLAHEAFHGNESLYVSHHAFDLALGDVFL